MKTRATALTSIIVLTTILLTATPHPPASAYGGVSYHVSGDELVVDTLLLRIVIDLGNGGIVKQITVKPLDYTITGTRKTVSGTVDAAIMDIIPVGKPVENPSATTDWPGEAIGKTAEYNVVEKNPYRLVIETYYYLSYPTGVILRKRYTFYYDKYYFDTEYVFENKHVSRVKFWFDRFNRDTGFGIELVTRYGASHMDDYQEITFVNNTGKLYSPPISHWDPRYGGEPFYAPSMIKSTGLLAEPGDRGLRWPASEYGVSLICAQLGDSVGYTYAVWLEIAVDTSNIVSRLEFRSFDVAPGAEKSFAVRFYTGPLREPELLSAGLDTLEQVLSENNLLSTNPQAPGGYTEPPHTLTIQLDLEGGIAPPSTHIVLKYLNENNTYTYIGRYRLDKVETTISVDRNGIYRISLGDTEGITIDEKYYFSFAGYTVNGRFYPNTTLEIPVYRDTMVEIKFILTPVAKIHIAVVDENDNPRPDIAGHVVITVRDGGEARTYRLASAEDTLYIIAGRQTIYIEPKKYGNLTIRSVYFDDIIVFTDENDTHIWFTRDLSQGEHTIKILYGTPPPPETPPILPDTVFMMLSVIIVAVFAALAILIIRRRRY